MVAVLKRKNQALFGVEALLCLLAVAGSMVARHYDAQMSGALFVEQFGLRLVLYVSIWGLAIFLNDLHLIQVMVDKRRMLPRLAKATIVASALYAFAAALLPDAAQGRVVFFMSILAVNGLLITLYLLIGRVLESPAFLQRVLVLGNGHLGSTVRQALKSGDYRQILIDNPETEARVMDGISRIGLANSNDTRELERLCDGIDLVVLAFDSSSWPEGAGIEASSGSVRESGSFKTFKVLNLDAFRSLEVEPRSTTDPARSQRRAEREVTQYPMDTVLRGLFALKLSGINIVHGLDYYEQLTGRVYVGGPEDPLFFSRAKFNIDLLSLAIKGLWERVIAAIMLFIALPFMALVPLAIWLDDGRPLLFVQPRVGRFGKVYKLYKWRSMNDKGEVTRVGRIIRKTKLDELPQLINVLKGEMSLVGPRPELPKFVEDFEKQDSYYALRHMVKPGLTGWAQIMFPEAKATDAMTKLSYDLYYVKHFSLVSDMVIMLETFKMIVFSGMANAARMAAPSHKSSGNLELAARSN